ncbi:MAG: purine-binding chemotaxis protein CheW [Solirubrobacteraceae bacterium]|nr:purine-binding chemotaxis protein CheW [Solirubrobacteraceae bacterium]
MSDHEQLVIFTVGGEQYALPIDRVREIIRLRDLRTVDASDPAIRGVISLRGKIIPVHDLAVRLGLPPQQADGAKIVIVEGAGEAVGAIVDDVEEVHTVPTSEIEPVPDVGSELLTGIARIEERLVAVLDCDRAFPGHRVADEALA